MAKRKKKKSNTKPNKNSPCPCGSEIKYKKCCGSKLAKSSPLWQLKKLETEFKKYNKLELISALGGIQTYPGNHSQLLRLECASRIGCKSADSGNDNIEPTNFSKILKTYLPSQGPIGIQEDPIEGLFTNNIMFLEGNYTVYDGLSHTDSFVVQNLLKTIYYNRKDLPKKFTYSAFIASKCLLSLINEVANRNDHYRYMESQDRWRENIEIPDANMLKNLSNAVVFSKKEAQKIISVDDSFLIPFVLPVGSDKFNMEDVIKNPLIMAPFVEVDDNIILANPGAMMGTLIHFIWVKCHQFGAEEILLQKLKDKIWIDINNNLHIMSFKPTDLSIPSWEWDVGKEALFEIDSDKLAYVLFITDDLKDFNPAEPYGVWDNGVYYELVDERCEFISKWLTEGETPHCKELLILLVIGQIGRFGSFGLNKLPENVHAILMNVDELDILVKTGKCDNLSFWKFSKALDILDFPMTISFLDQYALYLDNNQSFYLSDDLKPNAVFITPDMTSHLGKSLRVKVANLWDRHVALYKDHYQEVARMEEFIPIYINEMSFERLVEGYYLPLWVSADEELLKEIELRPICWDIANTISYWLWQLTPSLKSHLDPLNFNSVHITFDLCDKDKWMAANVEDIKNVYDEPIFEYEISDYTIKIKIPFELTPIILRVDNMGDRLIIETLLKSFNSLLDHHSLHNNLDENERERILDLHAPLGMKKNLYIINTANRVALNPENIPKLRMLQEYDIENELNGLVDKLGSKAPPIGKIAGKDTKVKLCNDIVDIYYEQLKSLLHRFNWQSLLEKLIGNNEAICNRKASNALNTAPSIECYLDIQSKVEEEVIEALNMDRTALTTRVLIEIITAEPPKGDEEISMDDLDKLLATTYHIINWAMLSDQIHCEIYDIDLSILNSGRVGVDKKILENTWDPFIISKTLENVESNLENFELYYKPEYGTKTSLSNKIEEAFNAEFGLTLTQISEFDSVLIDIGFEQESQSACMNLSELKDKIKSELNWDDEIVETAIDLFSLKSRAKWEVPPPGFDGNDIWPWRYNRRLSYLRKPLIIGPESEDPLVLWGSRHVEDSERNLLNLIISGQYIINESTPKEMAEFIGDAINKRGKTFNDNVKLWFEENTSFEVHQEVPIGPDEELMADDDLGDIDVLLIDHDNKQVFSLECKNVFYGRNPREVRNEIEKFIGIKEEDNSWIKKHFKRHEWINENKSEFSAVYKLEADEMQIFSIFITVREIPTTFVRDVELPFISFTRLKREGINSLYKLLELGN